MMFGTGSFLGRYRSWIAFYSLPRFIPSGIPEHDHRIRTQPRYGGVAQSSSLPGASRRERCCRDATSASDGQHISLPLRFTLHLFQGFTGWTGSCFEESSRLPPEPPSLHVSGAPLQGLASIPYRAPVMPFRDRPPFARIRAASLPSRPQFCRESIALPAAALLPQTSLIGGISATSMICLPSFYLSSHIARESKPKRAALPHKPK